MIRGFARRRRDKEDPFPDIVRKKERERKEGRAEMWSGVERVEEAAAREEKPSRGGSE